MLWPLAPACTTVEAVIMVNNTLYDTKRQLKGDVSTFDYEKSQNADGHCST